MSAPARARRGRVRRSPSPPRTLRVDYVHTGSASRGALRARRARARGALARPPGPAARRHQPRHVLLRGDRPEHEPHALLARLREHLRRVEDDGARRRRIARSFHESLRFPEPAGPVQVVLKKRDAQGLFREAVVGRSSTRATRRSTARRPPAGAVGGAGERRRRRRRWTCCCSATATPRRRWRSGTPTRRRLDRDALRGVAVQGAQGRLQRVGARHARGRERASRVPPTASIGARALRASLRRLRVGALRPRLRQQAPARGGRGRALRVHRDRGERPQVRRRRHLQPVRDRGRRQRLHARTSSCTSSATTSPGSPTSTTPRDVAYERQRRRGASRGSRTSPPTRRSPKWKDLVDGGHAAADAVGEGGVRGRAAADPGAAARRSGPRSAPRRRWRRSSARSRRAPTRCCSSGPHAAARGRLRGGHVRGEGLLPAAGQLHHVHPGRGLLRGLPARHRAGDRPRLAPAAVSRPAL